MRSPRILFALFPLLLLALALASPAVAAPGQRVTARQLVRTVDSGLAGAAQAAGESGRTSAAFLSALSGMRLRVERIEDALGRRDEEFFLLVDQGSSDLGALRVAWARAAVKNDRVTAGLRLASASYRILRSHYGREGVRHRQGGPLSQPERRQFQRVQRAQHRFAQSLLLLRERALRRDDSTSVAELDRFRNEAELIAWAPLDLEAYLNALISGGEMRGEWEANAPYLRADDPETFAAADETVQDLYVESDIGHVFTVDLSAGRAHMEREVEVLPDGTSPAGAIQVYQLAQDQGPVSSAEEVLGQVSETAMDEDTAETEPSEELDADSLADPEGLEEAAELADSEILEGGAEDLAVEEGTAEEVRIAPPAEGETAPAVAGKAGDPPASVAAPKKSSEPVPPEPSAPPPVSSPIG